VNYLNNNDIINKQQLRLSRIIFNNIPGIKIKDASRVGLMIEIRQGETVVYKKTHANTISEG
jgi:hypothetical protein